MKQTDIIKTMEGKRSMSNVNKYKKIYYIATGKVWNKCLCGNGFNLLYRTCLNYAYHIDRKNNTLKEKVNSLQTKYK